jgi:hypothetical protein
MAKNFEKLIFGGLHEKHAVQRGISCPLFKTQLNSIGLSYLTGNTLRLRYEANRLLLSIGTRTPAAMSSSP